MELKSEQDEVQAKGGLSGQASRLVGVGMLAGPAFHEFNNLLTEVVGYAGLLKMQLAGNEKMLEDVHFVCEGTARISTFLKRLRVLFRESNGASEAVDPWLCLEWALKLLPPAERARVALTGERVPVVVQGNAEWLAVALHKMLSAIAMRAEAGSPLPLVADLVDISEAMCSTLPYWVSSGRHFRLRLSFAGTGPVENAKKALGGMYLTSAGESDWRDGLDILMAQGGLREYMGCLSVRAAPGGGVVEVLMPLSEGGAA